MTKKVFTLVGLTLLLVTSGLSVVHGTNVKDTATRSSIPFFAALVQTDQTSSYLCPGNSFPYFNIKK